MARRKKEETLLRLEKRKKKLKLAQLGQDMWKMNYSFKRLGVTVSSMPGRPTDEIACGLADMDIDRREELGSELDIGVEGLSTTSKSLGSTG